MTVRQGFGKAEHLVELASVMYVAYFLQRGGYGVPSFEQFHEAEDAMERANRRGAENGTWFLDDDDYALFEGILALHDRQLDGAPAHAILHAEHQLARFIAGDTQSPLPPLRLDRTAAQ